MRLSMFPLRSSSWPKSHVRADYPEFAGQDDFGGQIIHPQIWDETLDYTDKTVVVIGSGATAVTLIPSMADKVKTITMLQRSPGYMVVQPSKDWLANTMRKFLPAKLAYKLTRKKNVYFQTALYRFSKKSPEKAKTFLRKRIQKALGDAFTPTDFTPRYDPWDERVCLVPDGDLFNAIKAGKARIKTGLIERFDKTGIVLQSGEHVAADLIITATGLDVQLLGGAKFSVDGKDVEFNKTFAYEGLMFSGVPNLTNVFGYVNASWTLRSDIIIGYVCRLLNHMDATNTDKAVAVAPKDMPASPWLDFQPGYIRRVEHLLPHQGNHGPWINRKDYNSEKKHLAARAVDDGVMEFTKAPLSLGH